MGECEALLWGKRAPPVDRISSSAEARHVLVGQPQRLTKHRNLTNFLTTHGAGRDRAMTWLSSQSERRLIGWHSATIRAALERSTRCQHSGVRCRAAAPTGRRTERGVKGCRWGLWVDRRMHSDNCVSEMTIVQASPSGGALFNPFGVRRGCAGLPGVGAFPPTEGHRK